MERISIGLVGMPRMMRDLIGAITEGEPDIIVTSFEDDPPSEQLLLSRTDVTIMPMQRETLPPLGSDLLERLSRPQILGLQSGGRSGYVYRLAPSKVLVEELSATALRRIIRREPL